jgi:hypothetical protein
MHELSAFLYQSSSSISKLELNSLAYHIGLLDGRTPNPAPIGFIWAVSRRILLASVESSSQERVTPANVTFKSAGLMANQ